jgi:hypothetical protein
MKIYITYDRYECNEWFNIYHVSTKRSESIKHCKEVDLVDFISYGPDDCHSFQLQVVEMTKQEYEQFMEWYGKEGDSTLEDHGDESSDLFNKMVEIFENSSWDDYLISTDGCSDNVELIHYYGSKKGLDTEDDDIYYEVQEELFSDENLYEQELKDYIKNNY